MSRKNHALTKPKEFNLDIPASNGLRRGQTTGSCATAATKAALTLLLTHKKCDSVRVMLPKGAHYLYNDWDGEQYLMIPVHQSYWLDEDTARAEVIKDAGDDPDQTHGATLSAEISRNAKGNIHFYAGKGVGTITRPGIRLPVGEPAINPVPRQMMHQAVREVLNETGHSALEMGFDITLGCKNGEAIARKTFNPRLGIVGGISILGTSGIVEPMSLASWIASIEVYVRVALADDAQEIAFLPGKIARTYVKEILQLPPYRAVEIANFLGEALDFTQTVLEAQKRRLKILWLAGHPGKLAKLLDGTWNTHSSKSTMAMANVAEIADQLGFSSALIQSIKQANTVESIIQQLKNEHQNKTLWTTIEHRIGELARQRVPAVDRVEARLFDLHGNALGTDA